MTWLTSATHSATASATHMNGRSSFHTGMPPAVITISSLSPLSLLRMWMVAISSPMGAMTAIMLGTANVVITKKRSAFCPWLVISSSWRSATAIHTTAVSDMTMSTSAPAVCRLT
jgi:hypothetical protein